MTVRLKSLALYLIVIAALCASGAHAMSRGDLIKTISHETTLEEQDAARVLDSFLSSTATALKRGDRVTLVGFGSFSVVRRMAQDSCAIVAYPEFDFDPASKGCESPECQACTTYDADIAEGMAIVTGMDSRLTAIILDIIKREIISELFISNRIVDIAGFGRFSVLIESEVTRLSAKPPTTKETSVATHKVVRFIPREELTFSLR